MSSSSEVDLNFDPFENDPGNLGVSLVTLTELIVPLLDAIGARSVVEVGAYAGDLTALLLQWAERSGARVAAIDPSPQPELVRLSEERADLELVREPSLQALGRMEPYDAVVIDGDHNYYTVSEELRLVAERAHEDSLPLVILHDVGWPHARRDDYFAPELIPEEYRQPTHEGGGLFPGEPGIRDGALPYRFAAAREGGPRNGVLTAVEDFVAAREGLSLAVVPAFYGLGVVWPNDAPWAEAVAAIVEPWDRNPLVERLEANRVYHVATTSVETGRLEDEQKHRARKDEVLRRLLESRSFALAEWISRLRQRGEPAFSKEDVRRVLSD
jgi:SAM-dependent methyltransferase